MYICLRLSGNLDEVEAVELGKAIIHIRDKFELKGNFNISEVKN